MILELKTMEALNKAIDKLDSINYDVVSDTESKVSDAKNDLITLRDEIKADVDKFEEWANEEMNKEEFPNREIDRFGPEEDNYDEVKPLDDLRKIINGDEALDGGNYDKENN